MNQYILIRRLTGPAILLLLGIVALLSEMHLAHFSIFVPLLLILLGVLKLAERAALAGYEYPLPGGVPQQPGAGPSAASGNGPGSQAPASTSVVPRFHELGTGGGQGLGDPEEEKR